MPGRSNNVLGDPLSSGVSTQSGAAPARPNIVLTRRDGLLAQAMEAVAIFIGFYVLALITVGLLLLAPFLMMDSLGLFSPYFVISCYGVALLIILAIIPRPDRFSPPGPRLTSEDQPKLFEVISEVAERTGQEMPAEVYLIAGVNAFVTQRGGIMGLGSRRVMGIGLGAMQTLNISEFKCVLTHEFGHFYGGHLKFGPWIYHARMAMVRAAQSLREWSSWLYGPYKLYVLLFMRVTQKISRTQELVADELAACTYGAQTTAGSLRMVSIGSMVFNAYWDYEVAPRLRAGYRPFLLMGYTRHLRQYYAGDATPTRTNREPQKINSSPYDSHPSLAQRIKALENIICVQEPVDVDRAPATCLLRDVDDLEVRLFEYLCGPQRARGLIPVTWEPFDREMSLADYQELVRRHSKALRGLTPPSLTRFACNIEAFSTKMVPTPNFLRSADMDFVSYLGTQTLGAALMLALQHSGWQVQLLSKDDALCTRTGDSIQPFRMIQHLATGQLRSDALQRRCIEAGIADIDLSTVA